MPDMKRMSASVYGSRLLSAFALATAASFPIAPTGKPVAGSIGRLLQASTTAMNATATWRDMRDDTAVPRCEEYPREYLRTVRTAQVGFQMRTFARCRTR